MKRIVLLLIITLSFGGCKETLQGEAPSVTFVKNNSLTGFYIQGRQALIFNQDEHQLSVSDNGFRIQTDMQDIFFDFKLKEIPTSEGQKVTVVITTRGVDEISDGSYEMELSKINAKNRWFWNEEHKVGVVAPL